MISPSPSDVFDHQVRTLVQKGYPAIAGMTDQAFSERLDPLRIQVAGLSPLEDRVPFIIVIQRQLVPIQAMMERTALNQRAGIVSLRPVPVDAFVPLAELGVPDAEAYLVFDVDTGSEFRNVTPDEALITMRTRGRSPLTIEEGIALLTHAPEKLRKNHCFSLLGSRCGDRRVPALWISEGRPKLGWCWAGNPHTWLGAASCGERSKA